MILMIFNNFL